MAATRRSLEAVLQALVKLLFVVALTGGLVGISGALAISPAVVRSFQGDPTWPNNSAAYGGASAILVGLTLAVVCICAVMQARQFRYVQRSIQRDRTREIVRLALDEPGFAQCWGSRFAPPHVDERLFFYTNFIILNWEHAWEHRLLSERQARAHIRTFFDSEVPRMFWERYGDSHHPRLTLTRSERFVALMNEEYLQAIKRGPPSRLFTPMPDQSGSYL